MQTASFRRASTLIRAGTQLSDLSEPDDADLLPSLTGDELRSRERLITYIVRDEIIKGTLARACSWYSTHLQTKFYSHWHVLAQTLSGLDTKSPSPRSGDLVVAFDFLRRVAEFLKNGENLALVDIVDKLDSDNTFRLQLDTERALQNRVVFAAIGWLTMLYDANPNPKNGKLEVMRKSTSLSGRRNWVSTQKYCTFRQGFDYVDLPIYSMLGQFGDIFPHPVMSLCTEQDLAGCPTRGAIMVQSVCFSTLSGLAELNIEWVTSLAMHLELDAGRKTLKLFQFPSFCRMMAAQRADNILSRLVNDNAASICDGASGPDFPIDEYFEEILLTYRLLFGQDSRSWKAFSRMVTTRDDNIIPGVSSWSSDPLLYTLCAKSCSSEEAQAIYEDIEANEPIEYYPHSEFPFFGKRLLELQQVVQQHQPQNVRSLLNDRRNVAAWYNLWNNQILVLFATVTIFLMVLSLVFQVWQALMTLHPPNQPGIR
ncbi:hypothetical protein IFR05_002683 [Cadophora sp. M221]|nr:hypothetical protein IFR05_002683 [Cadophora sp. M221]